jgi:hypothetical protein
LLIVRQLPGERLAQLRGEITPDGERDPAPAPLGHRARPDQHQLEVQQLVERQPPAAELGLERRGRPMHGSKSVLERGKLE